MKQLGAHRRREVFSHLKHAAENGGRFPSLEDLERAIECRLAPGHGIARFGRAATRFRYLRIAGVIAAGFGDGSEPTDMGSIPVDLAALKIRPSARTFALKVRGDSMINAQIADGDVVIIEVREPRVGEIVAALIDGETTLKRFLERDGEFFLRAENPRYPDFIPLHGLAIQGVMRAVVRVCDTAPITR